MKQPTKFFVVYNAKFIAMYKSVKACLNFIQRRQLKDDESNSLNIYDNNGDEYSITTGKKIINS